LVKILQLLDDVFLKKIEFKIMDFIDEYMKKIKEKMKK
jgi:hypothetical protein